MADPVIDHPPTVGWEEFWDEQGGLKPGEHVSIFGPTGTGKTTGLVWFCEQSPNHALLVVTKSRDRLVQRLVRERGWLLAREPDDVLLANGRAGKALRKTWGDRWEKRDRPPQRIVFHPQAPKGSSLRARADILRGQVETLLDRCYEHGNLTVGIDETMFAAMEMNLSRPFVMIWNEGRSLGLSMAAAMQRPAWIPKTSSSAPRYVLIFATTDPDDLDDLRKIAGFNTRREFQAVLDRLPEHHHLLVKTRGAGRRVYVSRVVIRKRAGTRVS